MGLLSPNEIVGMKEHDFRSDELKKKVLEKANYEFDVKNVGLFIAEERKRAVDSATNKCFRC